MTKKICLETLKILLTPKEMKNITGGTEGAGGCGMYSCFCRNCTNPPYNSSWSGYYCTAQEIIDIINKICCGSGGSCSQS